MSSLFERIINSLTQKRLRQPSYTRPIYPDYTAFYEDNTNFGESFYLNLATTIAWTQNIIATIKDKTHIDYLRIFRSVNPVCEGKSFYEFNDTMSASVPDIFNYKTILSEALNVRPPASFQIVNLADLGKILRFEIDISTHDGAPAAEMGFVDDSDIPPIDTWFYVTKKYLYCWIPALFVAKMQDAIDVEILGSYEWLEKLSPEGNREIEEKMQRNRKV